VISLEGGRKDYYANSLTCIKSRRDLPFIVVTPFILSNGGGSNLRPLKEYSYSNATWDFADKVGFCDFDLVGIDSIIADVHKRYNGQKKFFVTGHSAGSHIAWAIILMHPEKIIAGATSCGNFKGRCIGEISTANDRIMLPVTGFQGKDDEYLEVLGEQFNNAKNLAVKNGYKNISHQIVPGRGHEPLMDDIFDYFESIWTRQH
jgi:alpha-beta hydrolase superfamily lysophospholipase